MGLLASRHQSATRGRRQSSDRRANPREPPSDRGMLIKLARRLTRAPAKKRPQPGEAEAALIQTPDGWGTGGNVHLAVGSLTEKQLIVAFGEARSIGGLHDS